MNKIKIQIVKNGSVVCQSNLLLDETDTHSIEMEKKRLINEAKQRLLLTESVDNYIVEEKPVKLLCD